MMLGSVCGDVGGTPCGSGMCSGRQKHSQWLSVSAVTIPMKRL